jgi:integrase
MDVERLKAGSPALTLSSFLPLVDAGELSGLSEDRLLRLAAEGKLKLYFRSRGVDGHFVRLEDLELDDPATGTLDVPLPHLMPASAWAGPAPQMLVLRNPKAVASELLGANSLELVFFGVAGRHDVGFAPDNAIKVTRGTIEVDTAEVDAVRSRLARAVTPTHVRLARTSRPTRASGNPKGDKCLSDAVTAYIGERSNRCAPDQARRIKGALDLFVELVGDRKLDEVDRDLIKEYRDKKLPMVPANENKIRLLQKTVSVSESIQAVDGTSWPRISIREQQKRMLWLEELFRWLLNEGWLAQDPAVGVESGGAYKHRSEQQQRPQDARDAFSRDELAQVFEYQWYQTGRGEKTKNQTYREFQPRNYWLPLLGLYTGARIRELCQMELNDIRKDEDGTWYFDINDIGSDENSDSEKSLKNRYSRRRIPVHPKLIKLGLIDWRDRLEQAGHSRFFPELTNDLVKGYGKSSTKWFGSFLKSKFGWARDGKRTFHSFRHTLITECRNKLRIHEHDLAQITGHGRGSSVQSQVYTKDRSPSELLELIREVDFGLDEVAPFDRDAGMDALKHALRRKRPEE